MREKSSFTDIFDWVINKASTQWSQSKEERESFFQRNQQIQEKKK